ncbi:MAG TPA: polysaccharide deacetylase family protein [Terriglobales bacterium]|nr:polysaccharide deacetylase family protein [Terriglobales bacterium]
MSPTGQWYGRTFIGLPRWSRKIALTFDDGPNDPYTPQLLEVIGKYNVKATFFMLGQHVQAHPHLARMVADAGHIIGNHTFNHPNLIFLAANRVRTEIEDCRRALSDAVGQHSGLFRPPFGGRRPASLRLARSLGLEPIMWNVSGWDWNAPSPEYIEKKIASRMRGGSVILLHDGGHERMGVDRAKTVIATGRLIARCESEGYEFVTIPEMMETVVNRQSSVVR